MWFKKIRFIIVGFVAGLLNGFFGAGGGLIVVPMLESKLVLKEDSLEPKKAHATSIGIIFPLSIISAISYFMHGVKADFTTLWWVLPTGLIGAVIGSILLKKINPLLLKRIFGVVMIISAIRILLR